MTTINIGELATEFEELTDHMADLNESQIVRCNALRNLTSDLTGNPYGGVDASDLYSLHQMDYKLVPVDELEDYARDLAYEINPIGKAYYSNWPFNFIDWAKATATITVVGPVKWEGITYQMVIGNEPDE